MIQDFLYGWCHPVALLQTNRPGTEVIAIAI